MRKVIVSMNTTLDGYMSGPDCELDWHLESWSEDMGEKLAEELNRADTILLGRITYEAMARYWPGRAADMQCPREDIAYAVMMNGYDKVVYSKTLRTVAWNNARLISGNMKQEISRLKQPDQCRRKDIIVYGSGRLVAALTRLNLVDEYHLWVHPVVLGRGRPLFKNLKNRRGLKLLRTETFKSGVVLLQYVLAGH